MPTFAVTAQDDAKVSERLQSQFPDHYRKVWTGFYFLVAEETTLSVFEKIGADGVGGNVFVSLLAGNYRGWGPPDAWEWLKLKGKGEPTATT